VTTFTKSAFAFLAASAMASAALASTGDVGYGSINRAQADIGSLEAKISNIEVSVDTNAAFTLRDDMPLHMNGNIQFVQNQLN